MNPSSISSSSVRIRERSREHFALYCRRLIAPLALPVVFIVATQAFLYAAGETVSIDDVVTTETTRASSGRETIFQRAFAAEEMRRHRTTNLLARNPRLIAIGSSTTMQVRFTERSDFYNAGGLIQSTQDLTDFADQVLPRLPKIELIYMCVDFWWFNPQYRHHADGDPITVASSTPSQNVRAAAFAYRIFLSSLRAAPDDTTKYLLAFRLDRSVDGLDDGLAFGLRAMTGEGWRGTDGSRRYPDYIERRAQGRAYAGSDEYLLRLQRHRHPFVSAQYVDAARVSELAAFLNNLEAHGVRVIAFTNFLAADLKTEIVRTPALGRYLDDYNATMRSTFASTSHSLIIAEDVQVPEQCRYDACMVDAIHPGQELVSAALAGSTKLIRP